MQWRRQPHARHVALRSQPPSRKGARRRTAPASQPGSKQPAAPSQGRRTSESEEQPTTPRGGTGITHEAVDGTPRQSAGARLVQTHVGGALRPVHTRVGRKASPHARRRKRSALARERQEGQCQLRRPRRPAGRPPGAPPQPQQHRPERCKITEQTTTEQSWRWGKFHERGRGSPGSSKATAAPTAGRAAAAAAAVGAAARAREHLRRGGKGQHGATQRRPTRPCLSSTHTQRRAPCGQPWGQPPPPSFGAGGPGDILGVTGGPRGHAAGREAGLPRAAGPDGPKEAEGNRPFRPKAGHRGQHSPQSTTWWWVWWFIIAAYRWPPQQSDAAATSSTAHFLEVSPRQDSREKHNSRTRPPHLRTATATGATSSKATTVEVAHLPDG